SGADGRAPALLHRGEHARGDRSPGRGAEGGAMTPEKLVFEISRAGRSGVTLPACDVPERPVAELLPGVPLREELRLPEVAQIDLMRHFVRLSQKNFSIDTNFYPLGSCTMKYNPKVHEDVARLPGFAD